MASSSAVVRGLALALGLWAIGCASSRSGPTARNSAPPPVPSRPTADRTASAPRPPVPPSIPLREELDVVYGHGGGESLKLDLYAPRDWSGPMPALLVLHGGGWTKGSKEDLRFVAQGFAQRGYVAMTVGYRLAPAHKFPAQINDAKCAVRWLRANAAAYQVDPDRVGVIGFSAGAHLALLMGLTDAKDGMEGDGGHPEQSSQVQAVVNMMGPTDLHRTGWPAVTEQLIADLLGASREQYAGAYWAASPVAYVRAGAPPVLTFHGTKDPLVPYEQARILHASLRQARVSSQLETVKGKGHGEDWSREELTHNLAIIQHFLDTHLKPQKT